MARRLGRLSAVLAAIGWGASLQAFCIGYDKSWPGYRPDYYSVAQEYRRSDFVVTAHVLQESWIGDDGKPKRIKPPYQNGGPRPWGFDPYLGAFYTVRADRVFKGKPPATIRLFSENSTARFWLMPGREILAFVSLQPFEPPIGRQWTLDTCGNFAAFPRARTALGAVIKARRKNP